MPTGAMEPTIPRGAVIVSDTEAYDNAAPKRWDIVVFKAPESARGMMEDPHVQLPNYAKRIIGLPGETIDFGGDDVMVDGVVPKLPEALKEIRFLGLGKLPRAREFALQETKLKLKDQEYFVVGDNAKTSFDSRFWGGLPKQNIIGKVIRIGDAEKD